MTESLDKLKAKVASLGNSPLADILYRQLSNGIPKTELKDDKKIKVKTVKRDDGVFHGSIKPRSTKFNSDGDHIGHGD